MRTRYFAQNALLTAIVSAGLAITMGCAPTNEQPSTKPNVTVPVPADDDDVIRDESGRIEYIVDLDAAAPEAYAKVAPSDPRYTDFHKPEVRNLIYDLEKRYGFESTQMTSWVGISYSAFLTVEQVHSIAKDPRVIRISLNGHVDFSAETTAVWNDVSVSPNEMQSWGKQAVNASQTSSNGNVTVYVLDAGVGRHPDLNVVKWINGVSKYETSNPDLADGRLVGCYAHATHVAGIIGAKANGEGIQGIFPGVPIVSVSFLKDSGTMQPAPNDCLSGGPNKMGVAAGLDSIYADVLQAGRVGILNMSFNAGDAKDAETWNAENGTIGEKIRTVTTPTLGYAGVFAVNSAGNQYDDACLHAYHKIGPDGQGLSNPDDGVMVVSAINNHGQPVVPLNGVHGLRNRPRACNEPGVNFGACVEAWAPGRNIMSAWANFPQSASTAINGYDYLSGTSMAAPHIAGLAALLAATQQLGTPKQIELAVRSSTYELQKFHPTRPLDGGSIALPSMNPLPAEAAYSTPYAEIVATNAQSIPQSDPDPERCFSPAENIVNPLIVIYSDDADQDFAMRFDSVGEVDAAGSKQYACDVYRNRLDVPSTPELLYNGTNNEWTSLSWQTGVWEVGSNLCPSLHATVRFENAPQVHWYVDGIDKSDQTLDWIFNSSGVVSFTSNGTTQCSLIKTHSIFGPNAGTPICSDLDPLNPCSSNFGATTNTNVGLPGNEPGYYRFIAVCQNDFGRSASSEITFHVIPPPNDAQFISQIVPTQATAGQPFPVSLTFKNAGSATWTAADNFKLGAQNPENNAIWGMSRQYLAPGDSIGTGETKTFTFNAIAPSTPGSYPFQWRMLKEGVEWFGDFSPNVTISVVPAAPPVIHAAQFVSQNVPTQATAGQAFPVSLTFKNTGSATWKASDNFKLGAQNPQDNTKWGMSRQFLAPGDAIGPGETKTFTFNAIAPSTPGSYPFQWRMLKEAVEWFGDFSPNVTISAVPAAPPAIQPISGSWYNPARVGWGLHVSRNINDLVLLTWFTYRPDGTPIWYLAESKEVNGKFTAPLYTAQWINNQAVKTVHGEMTLSTTSPTTGTLSWVLDGVAGSEPIEYLLFDNAGAAPNITGSWYPPTQPGWGVVLDMQGDTLVPQVTLYDASGQPMWLQFNGGPWNGFITLTQVTGVNLCPGCVGPTSYTGVNVGSMQIKNINGTLDGATLDLLLNGNLSQWNRTDLPIARLTF
ncbi:MAG: S8 family serine peptidase [Polyangiaceae bacterium]|nr:S8 family serine peptidase [Polyangiaceae bacterium]